MTRKFGVFLSRFWLLLWVFGMALTTLPVQAGDPVKPEQAFTFSVRVIDETSLEVHYQIRPGYYLYRHKLAFSSPTAKVVLGEVQLPPGVEHEDDYFGKREVYRDSFSALLKLSASSPSVRIDADAQGCWDGGICYPPFTQSQQIDLIARAGGESPFDSLLQGKQASAAMNLGAATLLGDGEAELAVASGGEDGRIAALLQNDHPVLVLLAFFGFGLLLAFTPCTLPMIPILSAIIIGQGNTISRGRAALLSLAYVIGMASAYAVAGVFAGLSGSLLTAALQNVWVLGSFAMVFVLLALSMFGFYELQLPASLQKSLAATASRQRRGGQLGGIAIMGMVSALIVGPCVAAPLAGALLYIARSGDALLGGAALFTLALGMGVPLIAVGAAARSLLPSVGPWMDGVRKGFGVLLLAVAIWLLTPLLPGLVGMLAWAALLLFAAIFLHALDPLPPQARAWARFWKAVGVILLLLGAALLLGALAGSRDPLQPLAVLRAQATVDEKAPVFERIATVAELEQRLAQANRPILLDFYADWCVSCKEMERLTFRDPQVQARLVQMQLLQVDVTANSSDDLALLQRFSLFGPPAIVFFDAAGQLLPQSRVVGFIEKKAFAGILDQVIAPAKVKPDA